MKFVCYSLRSDFKVIGGKYSFSAENESKLGNPSGYVAEKQI